MGQVGSSRSWYENASVRRGLLLRVPARYTDNDLGEALGQAFIKEAFGPQAKADTLEMVHELEAALEQDINGLPWMTAPTRREALVKLHAISDEVDWFRPLAAFGLAELR